MRSCSSRVIPFSRAIFSADWPMVRPVDGSAIAGASGARSRSRTDENARTRSPIDFARDAPTSARAMFRLWRMGTSDRLSAPPAMPISAFPCRISDATSTIAWLAEAQALFTVWAGTDGGSPALRTTSRARLGALTEGMTCPITTMSTAPGSISVRSTSSRTHVRARSSAVRSR